MSQVPKPVFTPDILDDMKSTSALGVQTGDSLNVLDWTLVAWSSVWGDYVGANLWGSPAYTKARDGFVYFRGLGQFFQASGPPASSTVITVPAPYRPVYNVLGLASTSYGLWEWGMSPAGLLTFRSARLGTHTSSTNWYDFNGVRWWSPPA